MTPFRNTLLVAAFTIRQLLWRRRIIMLLALAMIPGFFGILARSFARPSASNGFVNVLPELFVAFLVPIVSLLTSGNVVRDGIDDRTIVYPLSTPIGRKPYAIGCAFGAFVVSAFTLLVAAASAWIGWRAGIARGGSDDTALMTNLAGVSIFGLVVYVPFHALLGSLFKFPTVIGIVVYGVVDLLLATLPGIVRRTAPSAYLEALLDPAFTTRNAATEAADVFVAITPGEARFVVPVLGMLFLGMFAMQMSRRDLV